MVEVIVLGTGSAVPMRGQTNSAFVVRGGGAVLLVDCGPAILQQLDACDLSPAEITHVFVTHRHGDHTLGYPMLLLWYLIHGPKGHPLPTTITSAVTWPPLVALAEQTYGDVVEHMEASPHLLLPAGGPSELRLTDRCLLRTAPMNHTEFAPNLGVRVEAEGRVVAFTGDTAECDNIVALAYGADLLVHDATFSADLTPKFAGGAYGHCTAQMAGRYAAAAGAKHLVLTHVGAEYEGRQDAVIAEARREFAGRVSAPAGGVRYTH